MNKWLSVGLDDFLRCKEITEVLSRNKIWRGLLLQGNNQPLGGGKELKCCFS